MGRAFLFLILLALPAAAQEDPMALQRCIWRCLADSSGATDPRYHQCVERLCSAYPETPPGQPYGGAQAAPPAPAAPAWSTGVATDGFSRYAGIVAQDGSGRSLYYMCTPHGLSYLALFGVQNAGRPFRFQIGGLEYQLSFDRSRGELTLNMPPRSPFLAALGQGGTLRILDGGGAHVMDLSLNGAWAAIHNTVYACFQ
ncbi:hypothetical protein [Pseudooceanicola sp.]|uniref:hypothetical protein n=1 Tax=Pseudooceanicola sp. TaxID=1914328 RepID=UPI003511F47A